MGARGGQKRLSKNTSKKDTKKDIKKTCLSMGTGSALKK